MPQKWIAGGKMEIRRAKKADIGAIRGLDKSGGFEERVVEKYMCPIDPSRQEKTVILLAEENGKAIGKAEIVIGLRQDAGRIAYLRKTVVSPKHRNKGVATKLVKKALEEARKEGASAIDLHVIDSNKTAIGMYGKLGFRLRHKEAHMRKNFR